MCLDGLVSCKATGKAPGLTLLYTFRSTDVLLMLERFIEWVNEHDGIEWVPMVEIEKDFRQRTAVPEGAIMPKGL